jgi:hypothetical protein
VTTETGELGISFNEVGSVVQSLARVLVDRGWDEEDIAERLTRAENPYFDETGFWEEVLGPAVDRLAEWLDLTGDPEA